MFIRIDKVAALLERRQRKQMQRDGHHHHRHTPPRSDTTDTLTLSWAPLWRAVCAARADGATAAAAAAAAALLAASAVTATRPPDSTIATHPISKVARRLRRRTALAKEQHTHPPGWVGRGGALPLCGLPHELACALASFLRVQDVLHLAASCRWAWEALSCDIVWSALQLRHAWSSPLPGDGVSAPRDGCARCAFATRYASKAESVSRCRSRRLAASLLQESRRAQRRQESLQEVGPLLPGNGGWGPTTCRAGWRVDPRGRRRSKAAKGSGGGGGGAAAPGAPRRSRGGGGPGSSAAASVPSLSMAIARLPRRPASGTPSARSAWSASPAFESRPLSRGACSARAW